MLKEILTIVVVMCGLVLLGLVVGFILLEAGIALYTL